MGYQKSHQKTLNKEVKMKMKIQDNGQVMSITLPIQLRKLGYKKGDRLILKKADGIFLTFEKVPPIIKENEDNEH